jgi:hypothetical protein
MMLFDVASGHWVTPPHNINSDPPVTDFDPMHDW